MRQGGVGVWARWIDALLLVAVAGGLVWAVTAGDRESAGWLAMGAWVLVLGLVVPLNTPEAAGWTLVLIAAGCAGACSR